MTPAPPLSAAALRTAVEATLADFLAEQSALLSGISEDLVPYTEWLAELVSGGKRLRPAFCVWGYIGSGGADLDAILRAAASLELLQACALIHDDVMDDSDVRRGRPAAHRRFADLHREAGWAGDSDRFGHGSAILLGDLCLGWADALLYRSGFDAAALGRAKPVLDIMRTEVMAGQILDLVEQARGGGSIERALRVIRYKSATYTVERPLQLGAALAGASEADLARLSGYGLPLGEAFQLRDDVLGVFGDPELTGKPAGDDLREGKRTLLIAQAEQRASDDQIALLEAGIGDRDLTPAAIDELRAIIVGTGALAEVEFLIGQRTEQSLEALSDLRLDGAAREALAELALAATTRSQ